MDRIGVKTVQLVSASGRSHALRSEPSLFDCLRLGAVGPVLRRE